VSSSSSSSPPSSSCVGGERARAPYGNLHASRTCAALCSTSAASTRARDDKIESERGWGWDGRERSHLPLAAACAGVSIFKEYICAARGARRHTCPSILLPAQTPQLAPICPAATAPLAPRSRYSISNDTRKKPNKQKKKQIYRSSPLLSLTRVDLSKFFFSVFFSYKRIVPTPETRSYCSRYLPIII